MFSNCLRLRARSRCQSFLLAPDWAIPPQSRRLAFPSRRLPSARYPLLALFPSPAAHDQPEMYLQSPGHALGFAPLPFLCVNYGLSHLLLQSPLSCETHCLLGGPDDGLLLSLSVVLPLMSNCLLLPEAHVSCEMHCMLWLGLCALLLSLPGRNHMHLMCLSPFLPVAHLLPSNFLLLPEAHLSCELPCLSWPCACALLPCFLLLPEAHVSCEMHCLPLASLCALPLALPVVHPLVPIFQALPPHRLWEDQHAMWPSPRPHVENHRIFLFLPTVSFGPLKCAHF
mmetsp:Transcript_145667/g.256856  ORF Transcript_145667/g.256856 Transcript_145667/m.256856 type:complete len:284 (+) Transcript_145667:1900-2751(+)